MAGAARRVWEELYVCKKPAIEEVFKITLMSGPNNKAPDLATVREQVYELAHKLWLNYVDMERKATYRAPWELHSQIQSVSYLLHSVIFLPHYNNMQYGDLKKYI
jgi:hypothetical protein